MIASFVEGRVRLRADALKDPEKLQLVESMVKSQDGVLSTTANPRTGSLLVEYDPNLIPKETLLLAAQALEKELGLVPEVHKQEKKQIQLVNPKAEMLLLAGSLGVSLLGGVVSKRLHVAAGAFFLLVCGRHLYSRRRRFPMPSWVASGLKPGCGCAKKKAQAA